MKVAIYARESSDDNNKAPPIENQIERGKQWATENGHELITIYADNGFSGGNWKRPDWNQCINDAKRHNYQVLWVWNQDRIARDTEQFLFFYRNLKQAKVKIWEDTSNEYIDLDTVGGKLTRQSLAQASEIFRLITSEKVRKTYERKKKNGEKWGRDKKEVDIAKILELRKKNIGYRKIAEIINENLPEKQKVSFQTIRRVLQNTHHSLPSKETPNNEVLQDRPI